MGIDSREEAGFNAAMPARANAAEIEIERLRAENAAQARELAEVKALLAAGNERVRELTAEVGKLAALVAASNERVAELAAAAGRAGRKPSPPREARPPAPPPALGEDLAAAFRDRPIAPVLPPRQEEPRRAHKPAGRNPLPAHLPADESTSRPCACGQCGGDRLDAVDAFDEVKLTVVKEHQRRRVVHRVTARCRDCGARTTGEAPPAPYERSKVTCDWLAWFTAQKYLLLTPLDRLLRYLRLQGVHLSMGTAVALVERASDLLSAIDGEHWRQLKASGLMMSDGTHFPVVVRGVEGTHRGYLEVYLNGPTVVFQYEAEKGGETLASKLAAYEGFLVVDAEHRFNAIFASGKVVEAGCNAHGRRRFEAAEGSQPVLAAEAGRYISAMFAAEGEAGEAGLAGDELRAWRQARVGPLYQDLRRWMDAVEPTLLPDDELAGTIRYYRDHWAALSRWVDHPELPPDNSRSEREFQTVAKARHAWLHAGGTEGAHRAAILLGIGATARNLGVDVEKYLAWAFERRGTWRHKFGLAAAELTPAAYKRALEARPSG